MHTENTHRLEQCILSEFWPKTFPYVHRFLGITFQPLGVFHERKYHYKAEFVIFFTMLISYFLVEKTRRHLFFLYPKSDQFFREARPFYLVLPAHSPHKSLWGCYLNRTETNSWSPESKENIDIKIFLIGWKILSSIFQINFGQSVPATDLESFSQFTMV